MEGSKWCIPRPPRSRPRTVKLDHRWLHRNCLGMVSWLVVKSRSVRM